MSTESIGGAYAPSQGQRSSAATATGIKLKASCDFCALSKVKCDRGQPHCSRCINNGIVCHYSEARRIGKARRLYAASRPPLPPPSPSPLLSASGQVNHLSRVRSASSHSHSSSHDGSGSQDYFSFYSMPLKRFDEIPMELTHEADFLSQALTPTSNASNSTSMANACSSSNYPSHSHQNCFDASTAIAFASSESPRFLQNLPQPVDPEQQRGVEDLQHNLDLGEMLAGFSYPVARQPKSSTNATTGNCMKKAFTVLENLNAPTASCSMAEYANPNRNREKSNIKPRRGLDASLKNNRIAIDTVLKILQCPCSHDVGTLFLLVFIAHQVIESYHTLSMQQQRSARSSKKEGSSSSSTTDLDTKTSPNEDSLAVEDSSHVLMAIGGYILDGDARAKVIVQVLRFELQKLDKLLDTFSARCAQGTTTNTPPGTALGGYIESLKACWHSALQLTEEADSYI